MSDELKSWVCFAAAPLRECNYGESVGPVYATHHERCGWMILVPEAAARRQVALELDQCGRCEGDGFLVAVDDGYRTWKEDCPTCHGRGWLYKPETVEAVMDAALIPEPLAVAVLDALRSLDQEAPR